MAEVSIQAQSDIEGVEPAGHSLARDAWRRLLRSTSALVGGGLLLAVVLAALLAPQLSPYDPIKANQP